MTLNQGATSFSSGIVVNDDPRYPLINSSNDPQPILHDHFVDILLMVDQDKAESQSTSTG